MKAYGIPVQSLWKQQSPLQSSLSAVTAATVPPVVNGVGVTVANPHQPTTTLNINSFIKAEPIITQHSTVSATVVASPALSTRVGTCTVNQPVIAAATPSSPLPMGASRRNRSKKDGQCFRYIRIRILLSKYTI